MSFEQIDRMVGLFINTVPLCVRSDLRTCPVKQWLGALQSRNIRLREYEFFPLSQIKGIKV